jgi:hypothetical protein
MNMETFKKTYIENRKTFMGHTITLGTPNNKSTSGGRRKNRRGTKRIRKNRHRRSRRN